MSVDITARYGRGYQVSYNDICELSPEVQEAFRESEYAYRLNGYDDCSDYFFGVIIKTSDVGEITLVPALSERVTDNDNFLKMIQEYKKFFPNAENYFARYYLFAQYW